MSEAHLSRPSSVHRRSFHRKYSPCLLLHHRCNIFHPAPFIGDHEQCAMVRTAEHAGKTSAIEFHCLEHFSTFPHTNTASVRNIGVPDRVLGIDTDPIRVSFQRSPDSAVDQATVCRNSKGGEAPTKGVSQNQSFIVSRDGHPIWKSNVIRHLANRAVDSN